MIQWLGLIQGGVVWLVLATARAEDTPFIVLPSNRDNIYNSDISDFSHKRGLSYKETSPNEFLPSVSDPWDGIERLDYDRQAIERYSTGGDNLPIYQLENHLPPPPPIININPVRPPHPPPRQVSQPLPQVVQSPTLPLSENPLTRLKQQLTNPLAQLGANIRRALPTVPTIPPRQGYATPGINIPTYFGSFPVTIRSPVKKVQTFLSQSAKAISSKHNPYNPVTQVPLPLPVPTYLPISRSSEFSAGFQILVQYIVAMVGVAIILII